MNAGQALDVAIAVNGRIGGWAERQATSRGNRFWTVVPPEFLRDDGEDEIERLRHPGSTARTRALAPHDAGPVNLRPESGTARTTGTSSGWPCPAFGALVAEPLYRLTDTAVVGHLGTDELAGMTIANAVLATGFAVFIFLAYGTTAGRRPPDRRGRARTGRPPGRPEPVAGRRPRRRPGRRASGWSPTRWCALLGGEGAVADNALVYLRVSVLGLPVTFVILAGTGYLRGLQDTRTPLVVAIGTAIVNLVLEVWWIFGLDFGIGASALVHGVAEAVAAIVYVTMIRRAVRAYAHLVAARPPGHRRPRPRRGRPLLPHGGAAGLVHPRHRGRRPDRDRRPGRPPDRLRADVPARPGPRRHRHRRPGDDRPLPRRRVTPRRPGLRAGG